ncbi:hypothetical protein SO694_00008255 [Aureococcus anophagefferens]|uniref:Uncharacterized protein n=1 Tax=Aureococcus anophagefferens TaxID=44056 RepID=A0ABR1GDE2_AURAN
MGSPRGTEADALVVDAPARPPAPRSGRRALAGAAIAATAMFCAAAAVTARRRPLEATLAAAPLAPHAATLASAQIATPAPTAAAANAFVPWPTATTRPSPPCRPATTARRAPAANATDDAPFEYHATACKEDCNCTTSKVPVLNGLDVVSPFHGNLIEGGRDFSYDYKGYRWYFKNAINRRAFVDDPGRYEPRFGGFCAYGLASEFDANGFLGRPRTSGLPGSSTDGEGAVKVKKPRNSSKAAATMAALWVARLLPLVAASRPSAGGVAAPPAEADSPAWRRLVEAWSRRRLDAGDDACEHAECWSCPTASSCEAAGCFYEAEFDYCGETCSETACWSCR